ncbi:MAG: alanine racemase, partial [Acidobacteria bacterium]|nr:alanine racemase [Acidobacteriota bacterium]MDW7984600.1 alanine racemase [Acidobacteriota bacterium]
VLIEVRLSPESTKHGCTEDELPTLVERLADSAHLRLVGLMTIPPYDPDPEAARPYFRRLRQLRDQVNADLAARGHPLRLHHLSMGMSHDFEVAIEEGATIVRIGQAIFGPRPER